MEAGGAALFVAGVVVCVGAGVVLDGVVVLGVGLGVGVALGRDAVGLGVIVTVVLAAGRTLARTASLAAVTISDAVRTSPAALI